jgi:ABC-2 type transport system permease protein
VDEAQNAFSRQLLLNFDSSGVIDPVAQVDKRPVTRKYAETLINNGDYKFGVMVPSDTSAILILIDPATHMAYRQTVTSSLHYIIRGTQIKTGMDEILLGLPSAMQAVMNNMVEQTLQKIPPVKECFAQKDQTNIKPNLIQNSVPGFILFAMFFIVIPLSGSLISEKKEGSYQRLRTLPVCLTTIIGGKVLVYLLVCLLQFLFMMFIGTWVFPTFFNLPGLIIGNAWMAIAVATITAAFAAVGFGILVGSCASSHNQAALFGSVMVVLLGIISGTFFPVHLMPKAIQTLSLFSPVRWGIDNYLDLFVRNGDLISILPNSLALFAFFGLAMIASIAIFAKRK